MAAYLNTEARSTHRLSIVVILFLILMPRIPILLKGEHYLAIRKADTASVAKNFVEHPNIFKPRIDALPLEAKSKSGITGMEFPLYQYAVSIVFRLFDSDREFLGMAVSIIASFFAFLAMRSLYPNLDQRFLFLMFYSCPMVFIFSHSFMPGMFGLALSLSGFYFYHRKKQNIFLSNISLLGGALVRPFLIFFFIPFVWDFAGSLFQKKVRWNLLLMGMGSLAIIYLWYYWWCPYLVEHYGSDYFFTKGSFRLENMLIFFDYGFHVKFWKIIFIEYFGAILIIPFVIGVIKIRKDKIDLKTKQLLLVSLMALIIIPLITNFHFVYHSYFLLALVPFLTVVTTIGIKSLVKYPTLPMVGIFLAMVFLSIVVVFNNSSEYLAMITLLFTAYVLFFSMRNIYHKVSILYRLEGFLLILLVIFVFSLSLVFKDKVPSPSHKYILAAKRIVPVVQEKTQKTDFFVVNCPQRSVTLWLVKRKGFPIPNSEMEKLLASERDVLDKYVSMGVKWLLYYDGSGYRLISLVNLYHDVSKKIYHGNRIVLSSTSLIVDGER